MRALCLLLVLGSAVTAAGQTTSPGAAWDVAATTGVFVSHPTDPPDSGWAEHWYHAGALGVAAGRYLTPHVKLEGEVVLTSEGSRYVERVVQVPGVGARCAASEQFTRNHGVSSALVWQFFDNQWVHPFVLAGVTFDFERRRIHTWPQVFFRGDPPYSGSEVLVATDRIDDLGTDVFVRGLVGAGAKIYASPRAFFRADSRVAVGSGASGHVAFRLGFGVDF
jgi:hypothetical protein